MITFKSPATKSSRVGLSPWSVLNRHYTALLVSFRSAATEGVVPAIQFSDNQTCNAPGAISPQANLPSCPQGVSAMQLIASATGRGQKIYNITQDVFQRHPNVISERLATHSLHTRAKLQASLEAGLEVVVHERPVSIDGWQGAGYLILDPETGAGGYLIDGGSNGSWLMYVLGAMLSFALIPLMMLGAGLSVMSMIITGGLLIYGLSQYIKQVNKILDSTNLTPDQKDGSIKLLSAMTVFANLLGAKKAKDGEESGVLTRVFFLNAMISVSKLALDWIISLFENMPTYRGEEGAGA